MKAYGMCAHNTSLTDDASVAEAAGITVHLTEGDENNIKITTPGDIPRAALILREREQAVDTLNGLTGIPRTGTGFDVHAFAPDRKLILGGVEIPHDRGLAGHSDADVLIHALMDALLGAASLGDIGKHFPDTDPRYRGISSLLLLDHVAGLLRENGWRIVNTDVTVIAQRPRISPYISVMKKNIAEVLKISESQINIKGTTTEHLGFTGREEGIAAQSSATIVR